MNPNENYFKDIFRLNKMLVIPSGIWEPEIPRKYLFFYKIYKFFVLIFVFFIYVSSEYLSIFETYDNIFETSHTLNIATTHLGGTVKYCMFTFRSELIRKITNQLEQSDFSYESVEDFSPRAVIAKYKKRGKIITVLLFTLADCYFLLAFLPYVIGYFKILILNENLPTSKPYNLWMPFKHDTRLKYCAMLAYQGLPHFGFIHAIIGSDAFLINVMNAIACHMEILQGSFKSIRERCVQELKMERIEMDVLNDKMVEEFKKMIKHLQTVVNCAKQLESFQTYIILTQILACVLIFCSSLLLLNMTKVGSKESITFLIYMMVALCQLAIYCSFGNNVTVQGQKIPIAIWESNWIDTTVSYKKMMIFTIGRMQKPVIFTIGKFANLTLSTFTAVVKMSYSVFAIFNNNRE